MTLPYSTALDLAVDLISAEPRSFELVELPVTLGIGRTFCNDDLLGPIAPEMRPKSKGGRGSRK